MTEMKMSPEEWAKKYGIRMPEVSEDPEEESTVKSTPERTNPNRRENEFMLNLMILRNSLALQAPACRDRARRAGKWTWRNIMILTTLVDKVQQDLIGTMPARRNEYYSAYARSGHYELVMNGPKRQERFIIVSDKNLAALCEAAMETECVMCMREGSQIASCPIRKALMEVAPPSEPNTTRWESCEYRDAASSLIRDEEIKL